VITPSTALTIAGSDSGGGAGIQADLATFAAHRVHGTSAITAVTAQNTRGVQAVAQISPQVVERQLRSVLDDFDVGAVKTGMLATSAIIAMVAAHAARAELANLVVDPVIVATSGRRLLESGAEREYVELLFPHAVVITPNAAEAAVLVGRSLRDLDELVAAAQQLQRGGARCVVVTGGDIEGTDAVDVVVDATTVEILRTPRVATGNDHGTGCTFSAAIAAGLANGLAPMTAISAAKEYTTTALQRAAHWSLGHGRGPVDHLARDARRARTA
jgi:hydroxymethylpyrimidine/phosphomethylpyrimidine kinase